MGVTVRGGVAASLYVDRRPVFVTAPSLDPPVQLFAKGSVAFPQQFDLPAIVVIEGSYNTDTRVQLFFEYAFNYAQGKTRATDFGDMALSQTYSGYVTHGGYVGARYFFWGYCLPGLGRFTPCLGFKIGAVWHRTVIDRLHVSGREIQDLLLTSSQWVPSGGLQAGLQWWFSHKWSLFMQREFVIQQSARSNHNILLNPAETAGFTNSNPGGSRWTISFPVTFGLRYTF